MISLDFLHFPSSAPRSSSAALVLQAQVTAFADVVIFTHRSNAEVQSFDSSFTPLPPMKQFNAVAEKKLEFKILFNA